MAPPSEHLVGPRRIRRSRHIGILRDNRRRCLRRVPHRVQSPDGLGVRAHGERIGGDAHARNLHRQSVDSQSRGSIRKAPCGLFLRACRGCVGRGGRGLDRAVRRGAYGTHTSSGLLPAVTVSQSRKSFAAMRELIEVIGAESKFKELLTVNRRWRRGMRVAP